MKYLFIAIITLLISSPAYAQCDLSNIKFGDSIKNSVKKYNLHILGDGDKKHMESSIRAKSLCKELSLDSKANFIFADNKFIHIEIENSSKNDLFKIAENNFGAIDKSRISINKKNGEFDYVWGELNDYVAVYNLRKYGDKMIEKLAITSKKYKNKNYEG